MEQATTASTTDVVREVTGLVRARYVFPEIGTRIADHLDERRAAGRYAATDGPAALAQLLTEDLQSINGDRHLRLIHHAEPIPDDPDEEAFRAVQAREAERHLGGVRRIESLDHAMALLDLGPTLYPAELVGERICAALQTVADSHALIIDLRRCYGGCPRTVALICSYLLDEETHLMDFVERTPDGERTTQSWTLPHVPGRRFGGDRPAYVLTSADTFSGGEELAYDLQQFGRATLVGERTRGGAHPRIGVRLHPHLEFAVPTGRAVHPGTGTNWEGTGVVPDVAVSADQAPATAVQHALRALDAPGAPKDDPLAVRA